MFLKDVGAFLKDVGALLQGVGAFLKDNGVLLQDVGVLLQDVGVLLQGVGVLLQDVGVLLQGVVLKLCQSFCCLILRRCGLHKAKELVTQKLYTVFLIDPRFQKYHEKNKYYVSEE